MVRRGYYTNPAEKKLEIFKDFSGGLNTVTSNDNLSNSELPELVNIDLGERGSLKRRYGMTRFLTSPVAAKGQGYFRYFKADGTFESILAINGKLYKNGVELPITGMASFQTTKQIEAVQFENILFIATGTDLVEYNGTEAKVVVPYKPQPLEAMYIGTNSLSDNPDNYLQDGSSTYLRLEGVTTSLRYGVVNKTTTFTAYVSKPDTMTVEYRFLYRKKGTDTWTVGQEWSTTKTWDFTPTETVEYEVDVYARNQADIADEVQYIIPSYKVNEVDRNEEVDSSTIKTCNRILLYWNRLVLYGDTSQPEAIYISHLNNPRYFPTPNSLLFKNEKREGLTALVRYRDMLVAFTSTSIQALYGKSPLDFARVEVNTNLGCISPFGACVMGNYVAFISREGVHILKALGYTENRLNVEKIDVSIDDLVDKDDNISLTSLNSQLHVFIPNKKRRLRYYYDWNVWTKDESDKLNFNQVYEWNGELYGQSSLDGNILKFSEGVWDDDGHVYRDIIETKSFDFDEPNHPKKLKELQLLLANHGTDTQLSVTVYADVAKVIGTDSSYASVDANGNVVWNTVNTPNVEIESGSTFGSWEIGIDTFGTVKSSIKKLRLSGKCMRTRLSIVHEKSEPNQILGLAYIFKTKRP